MTDRPLNILIVASWYPSAHSPNEGSFIEEQARMLKQRGHNVSVIHPFLIGSFKSSVFRKNTFTYTTENGINLIRVGVKPLLPGFRALAYWNCIHQTAKALTRVNINSDSIDIIHSHAAFMGGIVGLSLAKRYKCKLIHTEHTSGMIFQPSQYTRKDVSLIRKLYREADRTLFVSSYALNATLHNYGIYKTENHNVLHNVVDDVFFDSPLNDHSGNNRPFSYLAINNLIRRKGVEKLLHSWKSVIQTFPNSQLTIAGEGELKNHLVALASKLEIEDSVVFIPKLNRKEVLIEISRHEVIVSASEVETFGLTIAEAQAMGKPVVVADSGGVRDIVTPESGIITEMSAEDYTKGLVSIQKNYAIYNVNSIRELTYQKFSSGVIYKKLLAIYQSVLV